MRFFKFLLVYVYLKIAERDGNAFSAAIKNAKFKAVVEIEQEVNDSRDASSGK